MTNESRLLGAATAAIVLVLAAGVGALVARPQGPELLRRQAYGPAADFSTADRVLVEPGQLDQALVASQADGTVLSLGAGVHRLEAPLRLGARQTLEGAPGAIVRGSVPVERWRAEHGLWVADGQTQEMPRPPELQPDLGIPYCREDAPRCRYPEGVFLDGRELRAVASGDDLRAGTFFLDYEADRLWLADDPRGRLVEVTRTSQAVAGGGPGVRITNLVIEQFASPTQAPAMVDDDGADGWQVTGNLLRGAAGAAVRLSGDGWVLRGNDVTANGQLGMKGKGSGGLVEGNRISGNNTRGYAPGFESSGAKFTSTTGLVVRGNWASDNDGNGLWTDIDNIDTVYEQNLVERNTHKGIFHEISYDAVVRANVVVDNGAGAPYWFDGAGITVVNSRNVEVSDNILRGNLSGVAGRQDVRTGPGRHGEWRLEGMTMRGNDITHPGVPNRLGVNGHAAGITAHDGTDSPAFSAGSNRFAANVYRAESGATSAFAWKAAVLGWEAWRAQGHDAQGRFSGSQR